MNIVKELDELVKQQIIDQATAQRIKEYAENKKTDFTYHRLLAVFGTLGALLVGLGIIILLAHNWDFIPRWLKTFISFIPLLLGQLACGYLLFKKTLKPWYAEAVSVFTSLSVGLTIAMVHQVYNLPENSLSSFIMLWTLLALPTAYLMKSRATVILYMIGVISLCFFGIEEVSTYWISIGQFILILPFFIRQVRQPNKSLVTNIFHFLVAIYVSSAFIILLYHLNHLQDFSIYIILLAGIFIVIGKYLEKQTYYNIYKLLGIFTIVIFFFSASIYMRVEPNSIYKFIKIGVMFALYAASLVKYFVLDKKKADIILFYPIVYILCYILKVYIFYDLAIFIIGVWYVSKGLTSERFLLVNFGLLTISIEIGYRFFDSSLSFIIKGIVFILLGVGFFVTNGIILKSRKNG